MALPATEAFTGAAGPVGANWTQQRTTRTVNRDGSGAGIQDAIDNAGDVTAFWSADTFASDHYAQVAIVAVGLAARSINVVVRASASGDASWNAYDFYTNTLSGAGNTELAKVVSGSATVLRNYTATFVTTDTIKATAVGTTLEFFKNGVSLGTQVDSAIPSGGSPGVGSFQGTGATAGTFDNWQGDSLGGIVVGSTGTRRVGKARGPHDQRGFLKRTFWDLSVIAVVAGAITGSGSMETNTSFAYSGTSTQAESGTGSLAVGSRAFAGTSVQSLSGSGSLAISSPAYSGTVTQSIPSSGSLAIASPQYLGTVSQSETGTGSLAIAKPAYTGTVAQAETGTGVLASASPAFTGTVVQTGSGSGSLAIGSPAFSGTVGQQSTGSGTLPVTLVLSGTATNGNTVTGTGSVAVAQPAYTGTVVQSETGSGSLAIGSPAPSGTVSQTGTGTGSLATTPSVSGTGIAGGIGSGSLAVPAPGVSGTGTNVSPALVGKYKSEHDSARTDVAASTGFGAEHTSALKDIAGATGFSPEHRSALKDIGDAGV